MHELLAEGPEPKQRVRIALAPDEPAVVGREPGVDLPVPWDRSISRRHVEVVLHDGQLSVRRLPAATNPLFFQGQQVDACELKPGEHFVLGGTCFVLADAHTAMQDSSTSNSPMEEMTFSRQALQEVRYRDPDKRIEVLSHLPELIWGARTDSDLHARLVNLLLAGIGDADAAAVVALDAPDDIRILHWERRRETAGDFRPSSRLMHEALRKRRQSVLHVWEKLGTADQSFTMAQEFDWAFCTPLHGPANEAWGLYVAGRFEKNQPQRDTLRASGLFLQSDIKFAELVAEIVSSVRKLNQLERQQAGLRKHFSPVIMSALGDTLDPKLLTPRETDVTVLFCDLRGFSKKAEVLRDDLLSLLDRVSQALGVMTRHINTHGGVIGDFQGDAAMGFWGWPLTTPDDSLRACRAALAIRAAFEATAGQTGHVLADFQMGIGLSRGRAVAGSIGTSDQVKVSVFGPVVNLASRLESMTRQLRVPILIDEQLADIVRARMSPGEARTRRLARVQPFGMELPVTVSELLPPEDVCPELTNEQLANYDSAVEHFIAGRWDEAYRQLRRMPPGDRAQDFLSLLIAQHNRTAPPDWTGVVRLPSK